jgi:phosphatidylinositol alpha-1,6-mannosyltransferase
MRGKRLLILASEFPPGPGGIGVHAHELAKGLSARGWKVRVRTCQDYANREEIEAFNCQQMFEISSLRRGARMTRLAYLTAGAMRDRRWGADVVVASGRNALLAGALLRARGEAKLAAVAHGTELLTGGRVQNAAVGWALRSADVVIAVSRHTARVVQEKHGVRRRVEVILNGADGEWYRPAGDGEVEAWRRQRGPGQGPVILTVGHVSERKGQEVVVRALPKVAALAPGVEYWMAGLETERERVELAAREAGVTDRIRFLGRLTPRELGACLQSCDVFAMTSRMVDGDYEGFGIAVLEAALCGKPAVVSDCGGLPEAVVDGVTGLVVREGEVSETAEALGRLLADAGLRKRMGEAARRRVLEEGTWERRMDEYDRLLRQLAEG